MDFFIARQPVFNRKKIATAYELHFHPELNADCFEGDDGEASSFLLSNGFLNADTDSITRGKMAIISFDRDLLLKEVPLLFSNAVLAIKIEASVGFDADALTALQRLKSKGYELFFDRRILLEDIEPYVSLADVIKVDVAKASAQELEAMFSAADKADFKLWASQVNTPETYLQMVEHGFEFFSGDYISEPEVVKGKGIPSRQLVHLQLLSEINRADLSRQDLENIFKRDVALSFKLLNYINSAHFSIPNQIRSLQHAISLLGMNEAKRLLTLIILGNLLNDKSEELLVTAIVRANLSEMVAEALNLGEKKDELYLMGMFSVLDALLDQPLAEILQKLPIAREIKDALLGKAGMYKDIHDLVLYAEKGEWQEIFTSVEKLGLQKYEFLDMSLKAIKDANPIIL